MAGFGAAQPSSGDLVCAHLTLDGSLAVTGEDSRAWFRPVEGADASQLVGFRLDADELDVTEYRYAMATKASSGGVPLADTRPAESNETYSHRDATVRLVRSHADAQIRLVSYQGADAARLAFEGTYQLFANRSHADGWEDAAAVQYAAGSHPNLEPFFVVPDDRLILTGQGGTLTGAGPLGLWLHGFDIHVMHADGTAATYAGHPESQGVEQGPIEANAESWRDYLFRADGAVHLEVAWDGPTDLFAASLHMTGDGRVVAADAHGVVPGPEGAQEYQGADAVFEGTVDVTASHGTADAGDRIVLSLPAAAAAAAPAPAASRWAGFGWFALAGLLVAFVGGGIAAPLALRTWRRPTPPMPSRPVDAEEDAAAAAGKRISRLLDEGDGENAVPLLRKEVRKQPKNAELRYALGVAYGQAGQLERALAHLEYALRRDHAFLGMLVSDPRTQEFRHHAHVARLVRRAARRFRDEAHRGYA